MPEGRNPPPEKQLLNLIEQAKAGKTIKPAVGQKKFGLFSLFSLGGLRGRYSFYRSKTQSLNVEEGALNIKGINKVLVFVVLGLAVYLISSFSIGAKNLQKIPKIEINIPAGEQKEKIEVPSLLKKLPYYLERSRSRDIFSPVTREKIEDSRLSEDELKAKSKIEEASESLALVGIGVSATGEPDAMIKDNELDKVYFLRRGDTVKGLKIEAIFKDSVVLSYQGEELILK